MVAGGHLYAVDRVTSVHEVGVVGGGGIRPTASEIGQFDALVSSALDLLVVVGFFLLSDMLELCLLIERNDVERI